jgi:hypothetical protein
MAIYAYHRVSKDNLITLQKALQEGAWGEIETKPYEDLPEHLTVPILSLLKLRLSQRAVVLANVASGTSDVLTAQDGRWDNAQKRYVLKISTAEADDDSSIEAAGKRLRNTTTLGDGLAQTKLAFDDEVAFGEKQVLLSQNKVRTNDTIPSIAEDLALIGAEANMREIAERTNEFKKAIEQVSGGGEVTARAARLKIATLDCIVELNDVHLELEKQHSAAKSAETKALLKKLQRELYSAIPQEEHPTRPIQAAVTLPKS